jgi:Fe2+ or Zn2+ uptake regulation protein
MEITDETLDIELNKISKDSDFKTQKAVIELRGLCAACQNS